MALPLLIPVAIALAGTFGAGKTIKGIYDSSKANDIASEAQHCVDQANEKLKRTKNATNNQLAEYGKKKIETLDRQVHRFVNLFNQLKKVEISQSAELERLKVGKFTEVSIRELQHSCSIVQGMFQGVGAGAFGGALTAFGAYNGTMLLASAGTGTTISALSGAAATNATLAWLGGGTLASGGLGIAGGTMVLGVMVAGPALLLFGSIFGAKASKRLSEAKANMEKARTFKTEVDCICQKLTLIQKVTTTASDILSILRNRLRNSNASIEKTIQENGVDFSRYDDRNKAVVFTGVKYAQLVKAIIDTPILNENGEIMAKASITLSEIEAAIPK